MERGQASSVPRGKHAPSAHDVASITTTPRGRRPREARTAGASRCGAALQGRSALRLRAVGLGARVKRSGETAAVSGSTLWTGGAAVRRMRAVTKPAARPRSPTRRGKSAPAAEPAAAAPGVSHEALLAEIFAKLPDPPQLIGDPVPEVVRLKRKDRARQRLLDALDLRGPFPLPEARIVELRWLAERWARKGFDAAFPDADELEVRCAEEREELEAAQRGDAKARFEAAERLHKREVERRHGWIELKGLQLSARVYQDLELAYVPLYVEDPSEKVKPPPVKRGKGKKRSKQEAEIEAMLAMARSMEKPRVPATRALSKHKRLFLVGGPGSGKSMLTSWLAACAARGESDPEAGWLAEAIPFHVPARSLREATIEAIAKAASAETWFFQDALHAGRALLLVDGLDETEPKIADALLSVLAQISRDAPGTRILVTSRPTSTTGEKEAVPERFACVRMTAMTTPEVHAFIDKWCLAAELSLGKGREQAEKEAQAAAEDLKERVRLRSAIEKLAQTPLLCSVICIVHRFQGHQIPERRVVLYEAITNALLYEWDRSKFPDRKTVIGELDAQNKRSLLSKLARAMHEKGAVEWPETDIVKLFGKQLPAMGHKPEEAGAIIAEIRDRSGVLVERRPEVFGFSHLTFQEYLAAMAFVNAGAYERLLAEYKKPWWHEVIVLAAGFPSADAERIVRELLERDGEDVAEGTMLAAQCAETAVELPSYLRVDIEKRIVRIVPPLHPEHMGRLVGLGPLAGPTLVKSLGSVDAAGKHAILGVLDLVLYEPAISSIRRLMHDPSLAPLEGPDRMIRVAVQALMTLLLMALRSYSALEALREEAEVPNPILDRNVVGMAFKHALRERSKVTSWPSPRSPKRSG